MPITPSVRLIKTCIGCFLLLNAVLFTSFIASNSLNDNSGRYIIWGYNGNLRYAIYENCQFYEMVDGSIDYESGALLNKKYIKQLFKDFDKLNFTEINVHNCTGEYYYIINYVSVDKSHTICWEQKEELGKDKTKITDFFDSLMYITSPD